VELGLPGLRQHVEAEAEVRLVGRGPIPGQEERNADHLLEAGAAIRCNNLPALAWKIDRLLDDPARLAAMRASARRLARPHAARDIAATLVEAGSSRNVCPQLPYRVHLALPVWLVQRMLTGPARTRLRAALPIGALASVGDRPTCGHQGRLAVGG
jgi:hypothetical protein